VIQEVADRLSGAIQNAKVDIVPKTVVNMGGNGEGRESSSVVETLLRFITLDKLGVALRDEKATPAQTAPAAPSAEKPVQDVTAS